MLKKPLLAATFSFLCALPSWAGGIEVKSLAEVEIVVTNAKGEKEIQRVDAAKANVLPGDAVIFTTLYANKGTEPATDVVVRNPLPEHVLYVDGSAEGKGTRIDFSVDRGKTYAPSAQLTVVEADGQKRPATAADYTHIRWTIEKPLAPGEKGSVSFRGKVK